MPGVVHAEVATMAVVGYNCMMTLGIKLSLCSKYDLS